MTANFIKKLSNRKHHMPDMSHGMILILISTVLTACSTIQSNTQQIKNINTASATTQQLPLSMNIRVTPRIGLFNHHQYTNQTGVQTKWKKEDYLNNIALQLKASFPGQNNADWELLLTNAGHRKSDSANDGHRKLDSDEYKTRKLTITIEGNNVKGLLCELKLDGVAISNLNSTCVFEPFRIDNKQASIDGTITYTDKEGLKQVKEINGIFVPEDYLLVSMGDSFASGEGNPDNTRIDNVIFQKSAIWMDEQCHRSAWAGPIQAGIKIGEALNKKYLFNDISINVSGAYTVASVACSGATIEQGITGRYSGIIPLEELANINEVVKESFKYDFEKKLQLPPQTSQISNLLNQQRSASKKSDIDALVLSIGGNDVYFADLLTNFVKGKMSEEDAKIHLKDFLDNVFEKLDSDANGYGQLRQQIGQTGDSNKKLIARQILITEYPSSLQKNPCINSSDKKCYCSGLIAGGLYGIIEKLFQLKISELESKFADENILKKLNAKINSLAISHDFNWAVIKQKDTAIITSHGFCGDRHDSPYAQPNSEYIAEKGEYSWFRLYDESLNYQGDPYGAMHPSWQAHQYTRDLIFDELWKGALSNIGIKLGPMPTSPSTNDLNSAFFKPPFQVCLTDLNYVDTEKGSSLKLSALKYNEKPVTDSLDENNCLPIHDHKSGPVKLTVTNDAKRSFVDIFNSLKYDADETPPKIKCEAMRKKNDDPINCTYIKNSTWITDTYSKIDISAEDDQSGVSDIKLEWEKLPDTPSGTSLISGSQKTNRLTLSPLPEGEHKLAVSSTDKVENLSKPFVVDFKVDYTAPKIETINIYGVSVPFSQVLPLFAGNSASINIHIKEQTSGLKSINWHELPMVKFSRNAGGDGLWQFDTPITFENIGPLSVGIKLCDMADNVSDDKINFLVIPKNPETQRGVEFWKDQILANNSNAQLLKDNVKRLTNEDLPDPKTDVNRKDWPFWAMWLNLVDGRIAPEQIMPLKINPECKPEVSGGSTAFQLLMDAHNCRKNENIDSSAIWSTLLTQLSDTKPNKAISLLGTSPFSTPRANY